MRRHRRITTARGGGNKRATPISGSYMPGGFGIGRAWCGRIGDEGRPVLVSLGYEGRTVEELIADLRREAVAVMVDVRLTPLSRKPGMSKRGLAAAALPPREPATQPSHPHGRGSQIRYRGTDSRTYYEKKIAEGMTGKGALRALKHKISDALYARLTGDARRQTACRQLGQ